MNIILILLLSVLSFSKDAAKEAKKEPSLRPQVEAPKSADADLGQYKDFKMPDKKDAKLACTSAGGVTYEQGTASYESCMREAEEARRSGKDYKGDLKHGTGFKIGN